MKKILTLASSSLVAASAFAFNASTDPLNPTLISSLTLSPSSYTAWNGDGFNSDTLRDHYVRVNTSPAAFDSLIVSTTGGWRKNLNFLMDDGTTMEMTNASALNWNGTNSYAMDYHFSLWSTGAGTVKFTNATGLTLDLATTDTTNTGTALGKYGRRVIFDAGITAQVSNALTVSGRLTPIDTMVYDSELIVNGVMTVGKTATFSNTNFSVGANGSIASGEIFSMTNTTGVVNGKITVATGGFSTTGGTLTINSGAEIEVKEGTSYFNAGSIVDIYGKFTAVAPNSLVIGGTGSKVTVHEGGFLSAATFRGGDVIINGTFGTGSETVNIEGNTTLTVSSAATWKVDSFSLNNASLTLNSDLTIRVIRNLPNSTAAYIIAPGKKLTTNLSNFQTGSTTTQRGDIDYTSFSMTGSGATYTIESGTLKAASFATMNNTVNVDGTLTLTGTMDNATGTVNVRSGGIMNVNSAVADKTGTISVAGTINTLADFTNVKNFSVLSGGTAVASANFTNSGTLMGVAGTMNVASKFTNTTTTDIHGGTLNANGTVDNTGTINVTSGGTYSVISTGAGWNNGAAAQRSGKISIDGGTLKAKSTADNSYAIMINKAVSLENTSTLAVQTAKTYVAFVDGGALSFDKTSKMTSGLGFVFTQGTGAKSLTLNSGSNVLSSYDIIALRSSNNKVSFAAGESYHMNAVIFHDKNFTNDLTLDLNGATLVQFAALSGLNTTTESIGTLIFEDFANGLVKIDNLASINISSGTFRITGTNTTVTLKAYDTNGELIEGDWSVDASGYLFNSGLIPEPAEWAAIFGVLAIAFAVVRRRKK